MVCPGLACSRGPAQGEERAADAAVLHSVGTNKLAWANNYDRDQNRSKAPARAAPAEELYAPRDQPHRRLRVAEGRALAGGLEGPVGAGCRYPQVSRGGERLRRDAAGPDRCTADKTGR